MNWEAWVLATLIAVSTLVTIGYVGRPRKTTTGGDAIVITLLNAGMIWLVLRLAGVA